MGIESATYIASLNAAYPTTGDNVSQGDDHIRLLKEVLQATFPTCSGPVTASPTELNFMTGVTSPVQTQINTLFAGMLGYTWKIISTSTSAAVSDGLLVDSSGGGFAINLPTSPVLGNRIAFVDVAGVFAANPIIIAPGSVKICGTSGNMTVDWNRIAFEMVYINSTYGWAIV